MNARAAEDISTATTVGHYINGRDIARRTLKYSQWCSTIGHWVLVLVSDSSLEIASKATATGGWRTGSAKVELKMRDASARL